MITEREWNFMGKVFRKVESGMGYGRLSLVFGQLDLADEKWDASFSLVVGSLSVASWSPASVILAHIDGCVTEAAENAAAETFAAQVVCRLDDSMSRKIKEMRHAAALLKER